MKKEIGGTYRIIGLIPAARGFFVRARDDHISAFAAQSAFFILLSLVPFSVLALSLLSLFKIDAAVYDGLAAGGFLPKPIAALFVGAAPSSGGLTAISAIGALWSASRGILVITRGLDFICRQKETKNGFFLRLRCAAYTFILLLALVVSAGLMLFSFGALPALAVAVRYVTAFAALFCIFLLMYAFLPSGRESIKTRAVGAAAAALGWMAFTAAFSFYVTLSDGFSRVYGSLAAVALAMLWLYFCMYIFFLGGELNEYIYG